MGLFITRLRNLNNDTVKEMGLLSKRDNLYILSNSDDSIPIALYEPLNRLTCNTQIFISDSDNSPEASAFSLGIICSELGGNIWLIVDKNDVLSALNGNIYETQRGKFQIRVCMGFREALDMSKQSKVTGTTEVKKRTRKTQNVVPTVHEETAVAGLTEVAQLQEPRIETEDKPRRRRKNDEFVNILKDINSGSIDLVSMSDALKECIRHAYDGVITFKFQIGLRCGKENEDAIYDVLAPHYKELAECIKKEENQ